MPAIKIILSLLFFILLASFSVMNRESVPVYFYDLQLVKQSMEVPLVLVVLVPFGLGFVLAWSFTVVNRVKSKAMINKRNRTISNLNEELGRLKTDPGISETVGNARRN